MATYYMDYEGGNDTNDGLSFANRWKTWTSGATAARIAPGDTIRIMKSKDATSLGINGTWTDVPSTGPYVTTALVSSTNASPIVVTTGTHGLSTGDYVYIENHTTNTFANGLWRVTVSSGTVFSLDGSTGNGVGGATGIFKKVTNGIVTLASAVTKTIASTGNKGEGRTAWTASANVTTSLQTSMLRTGDVVDGISIAAGFTTGLAAYKALGSAVDFSAYNQVSFNIQQAAGTTAVAGDITLKLCSDTAGVTAVNTINIPALNTSTNRITVDTGAALGSSIQSVALYVNVDRAAQFFYIDNIIACKDSTSNDSLTLSSLIGKNTGNETWYGIASIKDTRVVLSGGSLGLGALPGYSGTTETVTTYKREPIVTAATVSGGTLFTVTDVGTAGSYINFEGGWDRTAMTTQDGETWYASQNVSGTGLSLTTKSFVSINKINIVGFATGFLLTSTCQNILIDNMSCNDCAGPGFQINASHNNYIKTLNAVNNNTSSPSLNIVGNNNIFETVNSVRNNSGNNGITINGINNIIKNLGTVANHKDYGAMLYNDGTRLYNGTFYNCLTACVAAGSFSASGTSYLRNTLMTGTEYVTGTSSNGYYIFSEKHDKTTDNHYIWSNRGIITSDTTTRHTASGISWKMSPTSTNADVNVPLKLSIAKIACTANNLVTVKAWMRRDDTGLTMSLCCPANQLSGITSDVVSSMTAAANTWEEITITFTPTEAGTVEIFALAYGGTSYNGYVDDMTITQA